ncbi:hypothetical protein [Prescottella sp. R16]|uniref:hypothetical protein n=1 Tax=Prescottella sp. R16 TaxID=3064529 RepID=UPI00272EDF61|nr:hypothetical protein [Prescottella sp. R16]
MLVSWWKKSVVVAAVAGGCVVAGSVAAVANPVALESKSDSKTTDDGWVLGGVGDGIVGESGAESGVVAVHPGGVLLIVPLLAATLVVWLSTTDESWRLSAVFGSIAAIAVLLMPRKSMYRPPQSIAV